MASRNCDGCDAGWIISGMRSGSARGAARDRHRRCSGVRLRETGRAGRRARMRRVAHLAQLEGEQRRLGALHCGALGHVQDVTRVHVGVRLRLWRVLVGLVTGVGPFSRGGDSQRRPDESACDEIVWTCLFRCLFRCSCVSRKKITQDSNQVA